MMSTYENDAPVNAVPYGTLSVDGVRQWRDTVEDFFCNDWQKLQDLILQVEASAWDENSEEAESEVSLAESKISSRSTKSEANQMPLPAPHLSSKVPKSPDPIQKQRLDELAKKIEARLKRKRD